MKRLIIARHGNTFRPNESPTRVGAKTDLELVEEERARGVGKYLKKENIIPTKVYSAPLKRTMQTAAFAVEELGIPVEPISFDGFTEINYGVDENKTEDVVIERIGKDYLAKENKLNPTAEEIEAKGKEVIDLWNSDAVLPDGWQADVNQMINVWQEFANNIKDGENVLVVSSNGIIRFAPHILSDYKTFYQNNDIKVATGGVCIFEYDDSEWRCVQWGVKAFKAVM